ncbi:RimJ/RimL family protein N-acetyltransferase [Paucibacter oligotrophus]|uniref:RimJ/RimL family protein N-acetyltransferase n=1 Tax=Roseateles oligotrophus TaxID=1769250 RepID=A0A840L207_9BURK|nr:GNAT family protein [Roseateles oligotrophus]MBB4841861.1 RimJ/RimL family protein N-acetyltransferase [Roseateles oligotrophus]
MPNVQDLLQPLQLAPVTLSGRHVRLEPLSLAHVDELAAVGTAPELWTWVPTQVRNRDEMQAYVETALAEQSRGQSLPFAILDAPSGAVIGSTRFGSISAKDRRLEIGWTWVAPSHQRSGANTEAKTLLLTHAFEALGALRVELKTDVLNAKSRAAILRLGAQQEGIFRRHVICSTGRVRDTVYFSIIDAEWPAVKARLASLLR